MAGLTYGTDMIAGQLVPTPTARGSWGLGGNAGPYWAGRGDTANYLVGNLPSGSGGSGAASNQTNVVGATAPAGQSAAGSRQIAAAPFSLKHSPLVWWAAFLVIGMAGLRFIHWHR